MQIDAIYQYKCLIVYKKRSPHSDTHPKFQIYFRCISFGNLFFSAIFLIYYFIDFF